MFQAFIENEIVWQNGKLLVRLIIIVIVKHNLLGNYLINSQQFDGN